MNARDRNLLSELLGVVVDALDVNGEVDVVGRVRAWLDVAEGAVTGETVCPGVAAKFTPTPRGARRVAAVTLASERGSVTSGDLAQACMTSQETARRELRGMASEGVLAAQGSKRGRCYTLAAERGER